MIFLKNNLYCLILRPVHLIFEVFKLALNIEIVVELDVYLLFATWMGQIQSKLIYIYL